MQQVKVRHCIFPSLVCLVLCEHFLSYIAVLIFAGLKNIFIFCTMAGGKRASEGKSKPSHKHTAID
jgi:hypothetical protein